MYSIQMLLFSDLNILTNRPVLYVYNLFLLVDCDYFLISNNVVDTKFKKNTVIFSTKNLFICYQKIRFIYLLVLFLCWSLTPVTFSPFFRCYLG